MKTLINSILLAALVILSGCKTINIQGQHVDDTQIQQLQARSYSQSEIRQILGTPTYIPDYAPNHWYYIEQHASSGSFFQAKITKQRIVKITFENNYTKDVALLKSKYNSKVREQTEFTATTGTEMTGLQKFVKNMGRFNSTNTGLARKKKSR